MFESKIISGCRLQCSAPCAPLRAEPGYWDSGILDRSVSVGFLSAFLAGAAPLGFWQEFLASEPGGEEGKSRGHVSAAPRSSHSFDTNSPCCIPFLQKDKKVKVFDGEFFVSKSCPRVQLLEV